MVLITAPSIIAVCDDSTDTSIFYSLSEEENGHNKNKISPFQLDHLEVTINFQTKAHRNYNYCFRNYAKPYLNLVLPPPDIKSYKI